MLAFPNSTHLTNETIVSLWASDSAHHFVARMSAVTVELQWKILPCTASAATGVRADTPAMQQSTKSSRALASAKVPFLAGTIRPLQVRWISPQWVLNFAVEIGEDACVGRHMPRYLRTFACYCSFQRGGAVAVKAERLKSVKYATSTPWRSTITLPFCRGNIRCAWSGSTQPRLRHWATPAPGNRGGTQQEVPPPKNNCCTIEGECCSSARDCREVGGSLLGVTEGAPSPFYVYYQILFLIIATSY